MDGNGFSWHVSMAQPCSLTATRHAKAHVPSASQQLAAVAAAELPRRCAMATLALTFDASGLQLYVDLTRLIHLCLYLLVFDCVFVACMIMYVAFVSSHCYVLCTLSKPEGFQPRDQKVPSSPATSMLSLAPGIAVPTLFIKRFRERST